MSPLEIQRLSPVARTAATSAEQGAKPDTGTKPASDRVASTGRHEGVAVEVHGELASKSPPIDNDRVAEIKAALKDGTYPILPVKIADAMIASQLISVVGK